jgi:hypothetical protein
MHHAYVIMQVLKCTADVNYDTPEYGGLYLLPLLHIPLYVLTQIEAIDILQYNAENIPVPEGLIVLDDVGVVEVGMDLHLLSQALHSCDTLLPHFVDLYALEGVLVLALLTEIHLPKGSPSHHLQ